MKTIQGPGLFLAQFVGDEAPFDTWDGITRWAAECGYEGVQVPAGDPRFFDLDRAADYKRRAEEAEKSYQKALSDARAEAQRIADATRADIQKQIDEATAKADAEINEKLKESETRIAEIQTQASAAVREVAVETAQALVEAVAPGTADPSAVEASVNKRVEG